MPRTRQRLIVGLLAVALAASACGGDDDTATDADTTAVDTTTTVAADDQFPVTVTGANGDVTIETRPTAIVSLSPSLTEMVYAVGAGDQVEAVDGSSDFPPGTPMTELSGFRPNVEAIAALGPDLVLLARDRDDVVASLETIGLTVLVLESAETIDDVTTQIETIGVATGRADEGTRVATDVRSQIDDLLTTVPERDTPVSYFYELSDDYSTVSSATFVGALLDLAGLVNIADDADGDGGDYPQLSAEFVVDADPDILFLAHADGSVPTDAELAGRAGWAEMRAVTEGRIVPLDPGIASRWGPRIVELLTAAIAAADTAG